MILGPSEKKVFWAGPPSKRCVTFLADTESYKSMLNLCFTTPATFNFTTFVPNKLENSLHYATVALST
jgi:hypothetical protein